MKKNITTPKMVQIRNIILFMVCIFLIFQNKKIEKNLEQTRFTFTQKTHFNPAQQFVNFAYYSWQYVVDFVTFRKQKQEIETLSMQVSALKTDFEITKTQLAEIAKILPFIESYRPLIKSIVRLYYSSMGYSVGEVYFESADVIDVNSFVFAEGCLVGRVLNINNNKYYVLSTLDTNFRLPVVTKTSQVFGILHGGKSMKFIPFLDDGKSLIESGETLVTVSSDGKFTEDLPVGTIAKNNGNFNVQTNCRSYYRHALVL